MIVEWDAVGSGEPATRRNSLAALGVIGLRMAELQQDNVACCGDCRFLSLSTDAAGRQRAICAQGYATALYATWAAACPQFDLLPALPEEPQGDERTHPERRSRAVPVLVERRSGRDRRAGH